MKNSERARRNHKRYTKSASSSRNTVDQDEEKNGFVVLDDNYIAWVDAFGLPDRFVPFVA